MDPAAFHTLVQRLEPSAAARPGLYKLRVAVLAALGYGYVLGMLALLAAVTVLLVVSARAAGVKLAIPLIVVIGVVLRALWVRLPSPQGLPLDPRAAPALFTLVETLRRRLRAPRAHMILMVADLNAAIVQVPRLGILGWSKNYLLVGLPLLQAVSPEEWQAVLAHELGHLSGNHGGFASWIYRLRVTWGRLLEEFERRQTAVGKIVFGRFFEWYVPYFNAYTFVLARAHEYEADAASAELVGKETAGRALTRTELAGRLFEQFWNRLQRGAADLPEPPRDAYRQLRATLAAGPGPDDAATWLGQAWRSPTDYADTHPALAARLRALSWPPEGRASTAPSPPVPVNGPTAAQAYLGAAEDSIELELDQRWVRQVEQPWRERHRECAQARERLAALDAGPAALSPEEEWERVALCATLGDDERADAHAGALLAHAPDHAPVHLYVGQRLLARGDPSGIAHVERGMRDPDLILPGCGALFHFHWSRGEVEQAERYREMAGRRETELREGERERLTMTKEAQLAPHDFTPDQVTALREQLERLPDLRGAAVFLARRIVRHLPEHPCYVLGIVPATPWWRLRNQKQEIRLRDAVAQRVSGPAPLYVFLLVDELKGLRRRLERIEGARVI